MAEIEQKITFKYIRVLRMNVRRNMTWFFEITSRGVFCDSVHEINVLTSDYKSIVFKKYLHSPPNDQTKNLSM